MLSQIKPVKKMFFIEDSFANKITYYLLMLFLVSLPFDSFYSRVILVGLAIHMVIHFKRSGLQKLKNKNVFILSALYFVSLICSLYTTNSDEALFDLTKELGILLFPLIFAITALDIAKYKNQLLTAFSVTCILTVVFLYIKALQIIHYYHLPLSFLFSDNFLNHHFSEPIELHATYFSMYISMALIFLLQMFVKENSSYKKFVLLAGSFILIAALIQLASRSVFMAMGIVACAFPFFISRAKTRIGFIIAAIIILIGSVLFIEKNIFLKQRYVTDLKQDLDVIASDEGRLVRWQAIQEIIFKKPFTGYGTGSEKQILKAKYLEKKLYNAYLLGMNTHNQYLGYILRAGIIGLLVYLFTLWFGFYRAIKNRDILFLGFMIIVAIVSVSENILDVNKGIFFYSFFFSFFLFSQNNFALLKNAS